MTLPNAGVATSTNDDVSPQGETYMTECDQAKLVIQQIQNLVNEIPDHHIFTRVKSTVNNYLLQLQKTLPCAQIPPYPPYLPQLGDTEPYQFPCSASTLIPGGGGDGFRVRRNAGFGDEWFVLGANSGAIDLNIIAKAEIDGEIFLLTSPKDSNTLKYSDGATRTISPMNVFWISKQSMGNIECIEQLPDMNSDNFSPLSFPPQEDTTDNYFKAWRGAAYALDYSSTHSGWWGEAGELTLEDYIAWVLYTEASIVLKNIGVDVTEQTVFLDSYIKGNYARLRNAYEQCQQKIDAGKECTGIIQFLSGFNASFLMLSLKDFLSGDVYDVGYTAVLAELDKTYTTYGHPSDVDFLERTEWAVEGRGIIYWWSTNEINCDVRASYTDAPQVDTANPKRWNQRYTNKPRVDEHFYIGDLNQFTLAGVLTTGPHSC